jgi:DNA-binding MarR family transcriptional regulator
VTTLSKLECKLERISLALHDPGISVREVRAFLIIAKACREDEPLTTEDVRRLLGMSSQTAHTMIQNFVDSRLIERRNCTSDGRARLLILTEMGVDIATRFQQLMEE